MGSSQMESAGAKGRTDLFSFDPDELVLIEDKTHPLYDERIHLPLDEGMVQSVIEFGVRDPIEVRTNGRDPKGHAINEVVDGRQRVRAAREANKRILKAGGKPVLIRALIVRGSDKLLAGIMVLKNEIRQDDPVLVKAQKLERLLALGYDMDSAAVVFGTTKDTLDNWKKVLELHPTIQQAMNQTGKRGAGIPMAAAIELAVLPREAQVAKFEEMKEKGVMNGSAAMDFVKQAVARPADPSKPKTGGNTKAKGTKEAGPRLKTRAEIETLYANIKDAGDDEKIPTATRILKWVLGEGKLGQRWVADEEE